MKLYTPPEPTLAEQIDDVLRRLPKDQFTRRRAIEVMEHYRARVFLVSTDPGRSSLQKLSELDRVRAEVLTQLRPMLGEGGVS